MSETIDVQQVLESISEKGFTVVESLETNTEKILQKHIEIVNQIGTPSEHNEGKKDFVWKIRPKNNESVNCTFSEHNRKADLHTDSQYRFKPEKYFSLSSIVQAKCGGGYSTLLDFRKVMVELKNEDKDEFLKELIVPYPIAIPDIFKTNKKDFIEAPLIENESAIRYRYDTIKRGMEKSGYSESDKKWKAFSYLTQEIQNSNFVESFVLKPGQILIVDNHRVLHGRTGFSDTQRLLYRIRFN